MLPQLVSPLPKNKNDAEEGGCWNCGAQVGAFAYIIEDIVAVCSACENLPDFNGCKKELVATDHDKNVSQRMLANQLRMCGTDEQYRIDMADQEFRQENISSTCPEFMSESEFKDAMREAIMKGYIQPCDIKRWLEKSKNSIPATEYTRIHKEFCDLEKYYDENPGTPLRTRGEIAEWLMKYGHMVYCQPTLDMLVDLDNNINLVPSLLDAYLIMHEKADLPEWGSSSKHQQKKWLKATLIMWGGPKHGTGPHFDWSTAHNVVFYFRDNGMADDKTVLAYWLVATKASQAAYDMISKALQALALNKPIREGRPKPPVRTKVARAALKKR